MQIIQARTEIIAPPLYKDLLRTIELAGRVCYKSEGKITEDSAEAFVEKILKRGHEAVIEHGSLTVKFICDRGVSHELVRHRLASYCQESTRYCNYSKSQFSGDITFIEPCFLQKGTRPYDMWRATMEKCEWTYFELLDLGLMPQEARSVLPNSLKTEVVMTANLREWRHFLRLRTAEAAHPQMRELTRPLLDVLKGMYPVFFKDIDY